MLTIKRILAPTDFSDAAERSLAHARALAATYHARLDVLHVIEEPTFPAMYGAVMHELYGQMPDVTNAAIDAMQAQLRRLPGAEVETGLHVVKGHAAAEITRFAEAQDVDLIVLASHGLGGLEKRLLGSVVERVLREAPCPVFVFQAHGKALLPASDA